MEVVSVGGRKRKPVGRVAGRVGDFEADGVDVLEQRRDGPHERGGVDDDGGGFVADNAVRSQTLTVKREHDGEFVVFGSEDVVVVLGVRAVEIEVESGFGHDFIWMEGELDLVGRHVEFEKSAARVFEETTDGPLAEGSCRLAGEIGDELVVDAERAGPPEVLGEADLASAFDLVDIAALHAVRRCDVGGDEEVVGRGGGGVHWAEGEDFIGRKSDCRDGGATRTCSDNGSFDEEETIC